MKKHSNTIQQVEKDLAALEDGFRGGFPKNQGLVIGGVPFTVSQFVKTLAEHQKPYEETRTAHALLTDKARVRDAKHGEVRTLLKNVKKFLTGYFGETNPKLRDFGIEPAKKRAELSAEQKAEKAAKARLTRAKNRGSPRNGGGPIAA